MAKKPATFELQSGPKKRKQKSKRKKNHILPLLILLFLLAITIGSISIYVALYAAPVSNNGIQIIG